MIFSVPEASEYAIHVETHRGSVFRLKDGFPTIEAAEDFKVRGADFARIWVEPVIRPPLPGALPWTIERTAKGPMSVRDANGERIVVLLGTQEKREAIAGRLEIMMAAAGKRVEVPT